MIFFETTNTILLAKLLKKDLSKVSNLDLQEIKNLISYYQIDNDDLSEGQNKDIIKDYINKSNVHKYNTKVQWGLGFNINPAKPNKQVVKSAEIPDLYNK